MNPLIALQPAQGVRDLGNVISQGGDGLFQALQHSQNNANKNRLLDIRQQRVDMAQQQHDQTMQANQLQLTRAQGLDLYNHAVSLKQMTPQQRQQALGELAPKLIELGLPESEIANGLDDNELDFAINALSRFKPQDPNATAIDPSSVREYKYFNSLPKEQQEAYLTMKRANPSYKLGDVPMRGDHLGATATPVTEGNGATQESVQDMITEQQAEKAAASEAATTAIKKSEEAFDRIAPIRQAISNYDEAMRLIDEGAETGVVAARLPSVKQASIELDNLQGKLGLDVIGNTTFGALSESELKFALDNALPKNLEGPALKDWLRRKKAAQQKLLAYTERAATFLGTPGNTVADWMNVQRSEALERIPPQAIEYLRQNPQHKDFFQDKYGVLPDGF